MNRIMLSSSNDQIKLETIFHIANPIVQKQAPTRVLGKINDDIFLIRYFINNTTKLEFFVIDLFFLKDLGNQC